MVIIIRKLRRTVWESMFSMLLHKTQVRLEIYHSNKVNNTITCFKCKKLRYIKIGKWIHRLLKVEIFYQIRHVKHKAEVDQDKEMGVQQTTHTANTTSAKAKTSHKGWWHLLVKTTNESNHASNPDKIISHMVHQTKRRRPASSWKTMSKS